MEFGTGHDVRPGDDITMETSSGGQDLGQATYDSDHDGLADSVIIIQGDHEYLITDADHDGDADSVRAFDHSGQEVNPSSGDSVDDPSGSAGSGTNVQGGAAVGHGSIGGAAADVVFGPTTGAFAVVGAGMSVNGDDGTVHELGAATVDLDRDGDGVADQMTRIGVDGEVVISVSDGSGGWAVASTGHLDEFGTLVEDAVPAS